MTLQFWKLKKNYIYASSIAVNVRTRRELSLLYVAAFLFSVIVFLSVRLSDNTDDMLWDFSVCRV